MTPMDEIPSNARHVDVAIIIQSVLKMPVGQEWSSMSAAKTIFWNQEDTNCPWMCYYSPFQILTSVRTALSSVMVNPLVSTCPAGTTVSAVTATMTTACFPPVGNRA